MREWDAVSIGIAFLRQVCQSPGRRGGITFVKSQFKRKTGNFGCGSRPFGFDRIEYGAQRRHLRAFVQLDRGAIRANSCVSGFQFRNPVKHRD